MPNTVTKLLKMNRKLHKNFCFFKIIMRNLAWGLNQCAMKAWKRKQKLHMTANNCSICIAPTSLFILFLSGLHFDVANTLMMIQQKTLALCMIFMILLTLWNYEQKNMLLIKLFCFSSDFDETWWNCSTHG